MEYMIFEFMYKSHIANFVLIDLHKNSIKMYRKFDKIFPKLLKVKSNSNIQVKMIKVFNYIVIESKFYKFAFSE